MTTDELRDILETYAQADEATKRLIQEEHGEDAPELMRRMNVQRCGRMIGFTFWWRG